MRAMEPASGWSSRPTILRMGSSRCPADNLDTRFLPITGTSNQIGPASTKRPSSQVMFELKYTGCPLARTRMIMIECQKRVRSYKPFNEHGIKRSTKRSIYLLVFFLTCSFTFSASCEDLESQIEDETTISAESLRKWAQQRRLDRGDPLSLPNGNFPIDPETSIDELPNDIGTNLLSQWNQRHSGQRGHRRHGRGTRHHPHKGSMSRIKNHR